MFHTYSILSQSISAENVINEFCGVFSYTVVQTHSPSLVIEFCTDERVTGNGFKMSLNVGKLIPQTYLYVPIILSKVEVCHKVLEAVS